MPTVLITGSNRGIGLEFVRQYAAAGWRVLATCRNPINVGDLSKISGDVEVHGLDINNELQIKKLANDLKTLPINLIINNAGVYGGRPQNLNDCDVREWLNVIQTNAISALNICKYFLPNLIETQGKIACISSKMGSITENSSGGSYIYRSSKSALNSIMRSLAIDLYKKSVAICILHPGWVQTDMGGANALISSTKSVAGLRNVIEDLSLSDTGKFYDYDGSEIAW